MFGPVSTINCDADPLSVDIVGHEGFAGGRGPAFDDGMPGVGDQHLVGIVDVRLGVVVDGGALGERGQDVECRDRPRRGLDARRLGRYRGAQRLEDLQLPLENPLVGAEHFFFVLLERRRDEPLAAGDRLLAVVVGRHRVQIRLGDLDVVAEHAVVADFQRRDAGPRAFPLFHLGDDLFARAADAAQIVELGIDPVPREPAVARQRPWFVDERGLDAIADVHQVVELGKQRAHERRLPLGEHGADSRNARQRLPEPDQVAGPGGTERCPCDQALQVLHRLDGLAKLAAVRGAKRQLLDRIEPVANRIEQQQRADQPRAEQPAAHRGDRAIELVEQRSRDDRLPTLRRFPDA